MKRTGIALAISLMIMGCNDSSDSNSTTELSPEEQIQKLEQSGELPKLDRSTDIAGPDLNDNGIRDDIEAYLELRYTGDQLNASLQAAKSAQNMLLVDKTDDIAVKETIIALSRAQNCLFLSFSGEDGATQGASVSEEIEAITTNTKERLLEYMAFAEALDGKTWTLPTGDTCND